MEQAYSASREEFLQRLEEYPHLVIQRKGGLLILRKGLLQMISLSIIEMDGAILVKFRPQISLVGLMILATTIVISLASIPWFWIILEVALIGFAMLVHSSQLTWEMLQSQEPIEFNGHSSNG